MQPVHRNFFKESISGVDVKSICERGKLNFKFMSGIKIRLVYAEYRSWQCCSFLL